MSLEQYILLLPLARQAKYSDVIVSTKRAAACPWWSQ
jgi:hypothetical protein